MDTLVVDPVIQDVIGLYICMLITFRTSLTNESVSVTVVHCFLF